MWAEEGTRILKCEMTERKLWKKVDAHIWELCKIPICYVLP